MHDLVFKMLFILNDCGNVANLEKRPTVETAETGSARKTLQVKEAILKSRPLPYNRFS